MTDTPTAKRNYRDIDDPNNTALVKMTDTPLKPDPVAAPDSFEIAAAAACDFIRPKLIQLKKEKGLAGVWSNGFRSGWDAKVREAEAVESRPAQTYTQEPVGWQYRYQYEAGGDWGDWINKRREDADLLLAHGVLTAEERRPIYTQDQLDAAVRAAVDKERDAIASIADSIAKDMARAANDAFNGRDQGSAILNRVQSEAAASFARAVRARAIREGE